MMKKNYSFGKIYVMTKKLSFLTLIFLVSCYSNRVTVLDLEVIEEKKVLYIFNKPDTIRYITLWNGKVMSEKEFNKKWDECVSRTTKKIKKEMKN